MYFKTRGGHWLAAAEDELGRLFMVDEVCVAVCVCVRACMHARV